MAAIPSVGKLAVFARGMEVAAAVMSEAKLLAEKGLAPG